jgi:hypothetical protein
MAAIVKHHRTEQNGVVAYFDLLLARTKEHPANI